MHRESHMTLFLLIIMSIGLMLITSCGSEPLNVTIDDQKVRQLETLILDVSKFVPDEMGELLFSLEEGPGRLVGSIYEFTPDMSAFGSVSVTFRFRDKNGNDGVAKFIVEVEEQEIEESKIDIEIPRQYAEVGDVLRIVLDGLLTKGTREYGILEAEEGLRATLEEGVLTIRPQESAVGEGFIKMVAANEAEMVQFEIPYLIRKRNILPTIIVGDQRVVEGESVSVDLSIGAKDPDGEVVGYRQISGPGEISDDGIYTLVTSFGSSGSHQVEFQITDDRGGISKGKFMVHVIPGESSERRTLFVGGEDSIYRTIQSAIDQADDGDMILIMPGIYEENLLLNKSVELAGVSRDEVFIEANSMDAPAVLVRTGTGFAIRGLTIRTQTSGIQVSRVSGEISDCAIFAGRYGIAFSGSDSAKLAVKNCFISSYEYQNTGEIPETRIIGLYAYSTGLISCENTIFEGSGTAAHLSNDIIFELTSNRFKDNRIAVTVGSNSSGVAKHNVISKSVENGILLNTGGKVELIENTFLSNMRHGLDLYLRECTECNCGGTVFRGTVVGSGNVFDENDSICPPSYVWPEGFYSVDESLVESMHL